MSRRLKLRPKICLRCNAFQLPIDRAGNRFSLYEISRNVTVNLALYLSKFDKKVDANTVHLAVTQATELV